MSRVEKFAEVVDFFHNFSGKGKNLKVAGIESGGKRKNCEKWYKKLRKSLEKTQEN